jgi:GNAT superfamily N-acetyltransferase
LPSDKRQALAFLTEVWEGQDHLPLVWDAWYADANSTFVAAERSGSVIGLGRLVDMGRGEWWMEGLRVDPRMQGQGVGSQVHRFLLSLWERSTGQVVRLATMCAQTGFGQMASVVHYEAKAVSGAHHFTPLETGRVREMFPLFARSTAAVALHQLLDLDWRRVELTVERLQQRARAGTIWSWKRGIGALVAQPGSGEDPDCLRLLGVGAEDGRLGEILREARRLAGTEGIERVSWAVPDSPSLTRRLIAEGYTSGWTGPLLLFEKRC